MRQAKRRRHLLEAAVCILLVAALGATLLGRAPQKTVAEKPEQRLRTLGIELPPAPEPVATYVTAVRVGDTLYVSGHGPARSGDAPSTGKLGRDLDVAEGRAAARSAGLRILSTVRGELGSLDKVVRVVKVLGMVNATEDFRAHPQVVNGFSDLMVEIFGEGAGKAARSAVGMASLPGGIPVEIEAIFQVR